MAQISFMCSMNMGSILAMFIVDVGQMEEGMVGWAKAKQSKGEGGTHASMARVLIAPLTSPAGCSTAPQPGDGQATVYLGY